MVLRHDVKKKTMRMRRKVHDKQYEANKMYFEFGREQWGMLVLKGVRGEMIYSLKNK